MKKWIVVLLLVLLLFGSVIGFNLFKQKKIAEYMANMPEPNYPVTAMTTKGENWYPAIQAIGFIEPVQGVTLTSEASGVISKIAFESGQHVKAGQELVSINSNVEVSSLESTKAKLPAVEATYKRYQDLYRKGSVSKSNLDEAKANYLALVSQIKSLEESIQRRDIVAPFTGEVGLRNVYLGQYIQPGTQIVRLEDTRTMRFRFTVPQTDISKIKIGQEVDINVDAYQDINFKGQITAIEPAVNAQTGLIQVQADIPNSGGKLRSGMFARARVILPTIPDQIIVPQTAITYTLYGDTVYVLKEQDGKLRAIQTVITTGQNHGNQVRILSGIKAGEQIVTTGQIRLSNKTLVHIVENDALKAPAVTPLL
ncbi:MULTISPECIES: efflux RND transporter periplasmic adaptor subunit [unclassified Photobacterium]|uniref:efflux RND transporter periplasmic adaptor subunit n=1 Tax=unclassified Photobacterium TaxID=2628852 RepID=UPI000D152AAA|nr:MULTISPECIES: efflux RND transporter periplasmic adaptor subunit [unclassified Photobacterium]PSV22193.1 efflux transporter periplasmic adaptor subunit [Photobacterium sp. GB-56]PSV27227.1 efflux transporter periplasmic adaptor subunit [Photobacterium sp. GB-72]PSV32812.1 efflux transporter periplasmic adaptor subunit [Photobacterium sp. GB-27]PSV33843.1 efflux transporter periplasmic adaptor subunit [Photobacterium sp. GB-210]PSV38968.1 efflux transporter periplasmic adaptor subunit [Photo